MPNKPFSKLKVLIYSYTASKRFYASCMRAKILMPVVNRQDKTNSVRYNEMQNEGEVRWLKKVFMQPLK